MTGRVPRRTVLGLGAAAGIGALAGSAGTAALLRSGGSDPSGTPSSPRPVSYSEWQRTRKIPYYIGHRGAGDVAPEHTLPSYSAALGWGAEALEISVVRSSDNVLYCMHDLTLDRTTTRRGVAANLPSSQLDAARVLVPRLGPHWLGGGMPKLPRLKDVLTEVGGKAVLCLEAKDDSAYPAMVELVEGLGLRDTVMIKLPASAVDRMAIAKRSRYPVFAYLGNAEVATAAAIDKLGKTLDPDVDALVLPSLPGRNALPADLIRRAVDTGVPVWVFPVHRRYEVKSFTRLGVEGFITPDLGYLNGAEPQRKLDNWASGTISAGELTRDPYSDTYALQWPEEGAIGLDAKDRPSFVSLGQFGPVEAKSYRIVFDAAFDPLPSDTWQHLSIAFGHEDDRYYEHRSGDTDGYHALLRAEGNMELYTHVQGDPNGRILSRPQQSTPMKRGVWSRLTLDVTPNLIRWSRDDGNAVQSTDGRFRGGYFHIGRSGANGTLKIRNLSVS